MVSGVGSNFEFPKVPGFLVNQPASAPEGPVDKAEIGGSTPAPRRGMSAARENAPDASFFEKKGAAPEGRAMHLQETAPVQGGPVVKHQIVADFEARTQEALGPLAHAENTWDISEINGTIPTLKELQSTFDECANDKDIPWEHIIDGCYARAHMVCEKLLDKGINAGKFYGVIDANHPDWRFHIENKFCVGDWWYHVAALTFAKDDNGKIDGYVIDPAVNPHNPIKASDWVKSYWNEKFPMKFDTTYADVYEPQDEVPSPHAPSTFSREKFDSMIPDSVQTDKDYTIALHDIKDKYYKQHPDEKPDGWS